MSEIQKLLLAVGACLLAFIAGLSLGDITHSVKQPVQHKADSLEYAVYVGKPINFPEDCVPVYIPIDDLLDLYQPGDTVSTMDDGMIVELPIRDAETRKDVEFDKVILQYRLEHNKNFPLNH